MHKTLLLAVSLLPLAALAGCQQFAEENYLMRSDRISRHAGDAQAANISNQMVDPWKRSAYDRDIETSGNRQATAYDTYNAPGEQTTVIASPVAAPITQ
ncbi:MAG: hypothetical protein H6888_02835 [Nitratireductor sp.]|nr:hypothetical protein [Nitratireductor sp.]MCC0019990.1 hypothetical protein [Nitratireductor sp.]